MPPSFRMPSFITKSEVRGFQAVVNGLQNIPKLHIMRLRSGVLRMSKAILERSQLYVPVSLGQWGPPGYSGGDLRASGTVQLEPPYSKAGGVTYSVSYGTQYAVYVHENTDQAIHYTTPGTGAKFLERAVMEVVSENQEHVPWRESFDVSAHSEVLGSGFTESRVVDEFSL